jgi:hypothetical protein
LGSQLTQREPNQSRVSQDFHFGFRNMDSIHLSTSVGADFLAFSSQQIVLVLMSQLVVSPFQAFGVWRGEAPRFCKLKAENKSEQKAGQ